MLFILIAILLAAGCVAVWYAAMHYRTKEARTSVVLQTLKALPASQLVVVTEEHLARISCDDSGFWLGRRSGHASIIVRFHWALNLERLMSSDLRVVGRHVTATLPPVERFDVVPDLSSLEFYGRKSGLSYIADALRVRTLRDDLFVATSRSLVDLRSRDGSQYRPRVIQRLNQQASTLFAGTGLEVKFE